MRRRLPVLGVALAVAVTVTACSSSSPAPPASPLSGSSALTCGSGSRHCVAPGTVRWSVRLPGSSQFDIGSGSAVLNMPAASDEGITGFGDIPNGYLATVEVAPGLVVFQQPGRAAIEAVDPATGRRLWATKLPAPPGFTPDTTVSGALTLSIVAAGGVITAYDSADYLWWMVNAATGAASPPRRLASYAQANPATDLHATDDVLPVTSQNVVLLNNTQVQGVDPATGSVRWQVPLRRWTGYAVIGNVLYADNDPYGQDVTANKGPHGKATTIQRVDLATGRLLPDLPLPPDLRTEAARVAQFWEEPGALLVEAGPGLTRLDPATGRPLWTAALPASTVGTAQPGPTGSPPTVEYLVAGKTSGFEPPPAGTGTNIWRVVVVSLATGKETPLPLGRSFPYGEAGVLIGGDGGGSWNLYGSGMLASAATKAQPAGTGGFSYTRLEGVDPQTGRILWRGPWAGDLYVLGETFTGPPVIIAESCAPSGLVADQSAIHGDEAFCNGERLYAINV
jgi:outer membrane protein assembly factor BamB